MTATSFSLGIDFGTTNSVAAIARGDVSDLIDIAGPDGADAVFRSALCFWEDSGVKLAAGPWAIAEYLDFPQGSRFLHPDLRFALEFPQGWDVTNGQTQVAAKAPNADVYLVLQLVQQPRGSNVQEIARANMRNAGFSEQQGGATRINGLDAYIGTYDGNVQGMGRARSRAAHIVNGSNVYVLAGLAPQNQFTQA